MIICISNLLSDGGAETIRTELAAADFVEGATTAGWAAQGVKQNQQLPADSVILGKVQGVSRDSLAANALFASAALPKAVSPVIVSKTTTGMGYGAHSDNALLGHPPIRSDLAFTIFLSPPEEYLGGELVIDEPAGEQSFKLPAGAMVLYPASTIHRVNTVEAGIRFAVVGWVQSLVRDARVREMLFDLDAARHLVFDRAGKCHEFDLLQKTYSNLLRLFAET